MTQRQESAPENPQTNLLNVAEEIIESEMKFLQNVARLKEYIEAYEKNNGNMNEPGFKILKAMQKMAELLQEKYPNGPTWINISSLDNGVKDVNFNQASAEQFKSYQKECEPLYLLSAYFNRNHKFINILEGNVKELIRDKKLEGNTGDYTGIPIQPAQRFPRHKILLEDLEKKIGKTGKDISHIQNASTGSDEFGKNINEKIREEEKIEKKDKARNSLSAHLNAAESSIGKLEQEVAAIRDNSPPEKALSFEEKVEGQTKGLESQLQQVESNMEKLLEKKEGKDGALKKAKTRLDANSTNEKNNAQPFIDYKNDQINRMKQCHEQDPKKIKKYTAEISKACKVNPLPKGSDLIFNLQEAVRNGNLKGPALAYAVELAMKDQETNPISAFDLIEAIIDANAKANETLIAELQVKFDKLIEFKNTYRDAKNSVEEVKRLESELGKIEKDIAGSKVKTTEIKDEMKLLNAFSGLESKIKSGDYNSDFFKENWQLFVNGKYSKLFMEGIAPNLTVDELFSFTKALMEAHLSSDSNTKSMLRESEHLSGLLYELVAEKLNFNPLQGNNEVATDPRINELHQLVQKNIEIIQKDQARIVGGANTGIATASADKYEELIQQNTINAILFKFNPVLDYMKKVNNNEIPFDKTKMDKLKVIYEDASKRGTLTSEGELQIKLEPAISHDQARAHMDTQKEAAASNTTQPSNSAPKNEGKSPQTSKHTITENDFNTLKEQISSELNKYTTSGKNLAHKEMQKELKGLVGSFKYNNENPTRSLVGNIRTLIGAMEQQHDTIVKNRGFFKDIDGRYAKILQRNITGLYYKLGEIQDKQFGNHMTAYTEMKDMTKKQLDSYANHYPRPAIFSELAQSVHTNISNTSNLNEVADALHKGLDEIKKVPKIRRVLMGANGVRLEATLQQQLSAVKASMTPEERTTYDNNHGVQPRFEPLISAKKEQAPDLPEPDADSKAKPGM